MRETRNAKRILAGKPLARWPLTNLEWRWEYKIEMELKGRGRDDWKWMEMSENRVERPLKLIRHLPPNKSPS
jgi:hypothetical protein